MKRILLLLCLAALGPSASAVFFGTPTAWEQFHWVTTDNNGNVYVSGTSEAGGSKDLLAASFNSSGTLRWSRVFDGGFNQPDNPQAMTVFNSNVNIAYTAGPTFGTQAMARTTGTLGVSASYTPATPLIVNNTEYVTNAGIFSGSRNVGGLIDAMILLFDGVHPPTPSFYGTSGYTTFLESVTTMAGTYVVGRDAAGDFVAKWDFATGTTAWKTDLPAGVTSNRIAADKAGNVYVAGTIVNTTRDLIVCKYSPTGTFLGQGVSDSGYDDYATHLTVAGDRPMVAGYHWFVDGNWFYAAAFRSNLTLGFHMHDNDSTEAGNITADASNGYVIARPRIANSPYKIFKFSHLGSYWIAFIDQSPDFETVFGLQYKSGMLLACGYTPYQAFVLRLDPAAGTIVW